MDVILVISLVVTICVQFSMPASVYQHSEYPGKYLGSFGGIF